MAKSKTKRRPRKSTFVARKEEKERLEIELARLQTQWRVLHATNPDDAGRSGAPRVPTALRGRHWAFHGLRSLLSAYFMSYHASAAYDAIHLPMNPVARRRVLLHHSAQKIHDVRLAMLERCRFLDLARPQSATEWFESDTGDLFLQQFDVTPFRGLACSVRDVHDAIAFYVQNVEIYVTERIGDLTIREDDEVDTSTDASVSQRRVVSTAEACGLTIDANVAVFRQLFAHGVSADLAREHSILATHSVESDALYPYVPRERVRHDLFTGVLVQQVTTPDGQCVTSLARSFVLKRHNRGVAIDPEKDVQTAMLTLAAQWGQVMLIAVKERLLALTPATPPRANRAGSASPASSAGSYY